MSYYLCLLPVEPTEDLRAAYERYVAVSEAGSSPESRLNVAEVAALIERNDPRADRFEGGKYVELTSLTHGHPVQYSVYEDHVGISLPYWSTGESARTAISEVLRLVSQLRERFGLRTYDPQSETELFDDADAPAVLELLGFGTRALESAVQRASPTTRRSWWRFW